MLELRHYQRAAIDAAYNAFRAGMQRPLLVLPTGAGKSVVLAEIIREAITTWPDTRILVLVHVRELVDQNHRTLLRMWPDAPATIYSAGLKSKDMSGQAVFASIQSIYRKGFDLQKVDLCIIDECHMIPPYGDGMYNRLLSDLAIINGGPVPLLGLTATPFRLTSGSLVKGKGRVFDSICHEVSIPELIDLGNLVPPITRATTTVLDTSGVKTQGGEFVASQLQDAVDRAELTKAACVEIVAAGRDRRSWLAFSTGVKHAFHIRDELRSHGVSCETVTGETPLGERDRIIMAFKSGEIRCLTNDSCLTTGFDHPPTDLIAVLRPTQSKGLWVQMCGRGLRPAPGKENCVILDFGRNTLRHGPLDMIKGEAKGDGEAPVKECPSCHAMIFAGFAECPHCGHEFEIERERAKHDAKAMIAPLLASTASEWLPVTRVEYRRHTKPGKPDSLRVDYWCGMVRYSEWVFLEHDGPARLKAEAWWKKRNGGSGYVPGLNDALADGRAACLALDQPTAIRVRRQGQFWNVVAFQFP